MCLNIAHIFFIYKFLKRGCIIESFIITKETLAIVPLDNNSCKIIELYGEHIIKKSVIKVLDESCKYFGSSYIGRFEGTKALINVAYKSPIVLEESNVIIFFPTSSPRIESCAWINSSLIKEFNRKNYNAEIIFLNGYKKEFEISYPVLKNQILRSARLEAVLRRRKELLI